VVTIVIFSHSDEFVTAGALGDDKVRIWDTMSGNRLRELVGHDGDVVGVAFSPSGKHVISGAYDGAGARHFVGRFGRTAALRLATSQV
jgi:WD40 repeat protein